MAESVSKLRRLVAQNIRSRRTALGITQQELAERMGIGQATVARYEVAPQNLTLELLERIAVSLDTTPASLLTDPDAPEQHEKLIALAEELLRGIRSLR